jgi:hypothetical protein
MSNSTPSTTPAGAPASSRGAATKTARLAGACVNPIRLRGYYQRIAADTGEVLATIGSPEAGDGTLVVSCKDRRENHCPRCARLYQQDAYQLIAAGLRGGKNIPTTVGSHPAVMLTLTAPSFGAVHRISGHGRPCRCGRRHGEQEVLLGTAIDPDSYRYVDQVIWNHYAPELWRRTARAIRRRLAQALGTHRSRLSEVAHVRFAKVAEFQRRGVVHYHAIIRIDGPEGVDTPPPVSCTMQLLERIVQAATDTATVVPPQPISRELGLTTRAAIRWGNQREVVSLDQQTSTAAAGYIAKYATKATEAATDGTPVKPIRSPMQLKDLSLKSHARALVTASWHTGQRTGIESFKRWAHQFGYGGHTLTKSRQYSVTFAALRAARLEWCRTANGEGQVIVRAQLSYAGRDKVPREP